MQIPRVQGILEVALSVQDVQTSAAFYRRLFNLPMLLETERLIAFDVAGRNVLLLFASGSTDQPFPTPGGAIPGHKGVGANHFAFAIESDSVSVWQRTLESAGVVVESIVNWPTGAKSIYFRDPDQHLVELITPGFWKTY